MSDESPKKLELLLCYSQLKDQCDQSVKTLLKIFYWNEYFWMIDKSPAWEDCPDPAVPDELHHYYQENVHRYQRYS